MSLETTEIKVVFKVIERHLEEGYGGLFIFFSLKGSRRVANGRKCVGLGRLSASGWVPLEIDFDTEGFIPKIYLGVLLRDPPIEK